MESFLLLLEILFSRLRSHIAGKSFLFDPFSQKPSCNISYARKCLVLYNNETDMVRSGKQGLVCRRRNANRLVLCFHLSIWNRLNLNIILWIWNSSWEISFLKYSFKDICGKTSKIWMESVVELVDLYQYLVS